jgi:hypothetical protein
MKSVTHSLFIVLWFTLSACFPDDMKKKMNDAMTEVQTSMADQTFRKTLGDIELHKIRYGKYPASLTEIKFLNKMDSMNFHSVEYHLLDSGYELNLIQKAANINGRQTEITVVYPDEFWQGLGCVKSNLKKNP